VSVHRRFLSSKYQGLKVFLGDNDSTPDMTVPSAQTLTRHSRFLPASLVDISLRKDIAAPNGKEMSRAGKSIT
jgi:hypothetical protein